MQLRSQHHVPADGSAALLQEHSMSFITEQKDRPHTDVDFAEREFQVWCSTRKRSELTAQPFKKHNIKIHASSRLGEMNPGVVDGMSEEAIEQKFPGHYDEQRKDPYTFRFPRAESYHDLAIRLEPVILELERVGEDVLIIGQSSVLRCLIAYLQGNKPREIPFIQVREGDLVEIRPQAFGVTTRVYSFWDPEKEREKRDIEFATRAMMALTRNQGEGPLLEDRPATNRAGSHNTDPANAVVDQQRRPADMAERAENDRP